MLTSVVQSSKRVWTVYQETRLTAFISRVADKVRERTGFLSVEQKAYRRMLADIDAIFDQAYQVNTGGITHILDLTITGNNVQYGRSHIATNPHTFRRVIDALEMSEPLNVCSFVDLGSGKGRALFLAAGYPFRRIMGIEFAAELHEVAQSNLTAAPDARIELIHGDAALFEFPLEPLIVYLYNPFDSPLMALVAKSLMKSWIARPRTIRVIYANPLYAEEWSKAGWSLVGRLEQKAAIFEPPHA